MVDSSLYYSRGLVSAETLANARWKVCRDVMYKLCCPSKISDITGNLCQMSELNRDQEYFSVKRHTIDVFPKRLWLIKSRL